MFIANKVKVIKGIWLTGCMVSSNYTRTLDLLRVQTSKEGSYGSAPHGCVISNRDASLRLLLARKPELSYRGGL
jgi:hypothetical protein